MPHYASGLASQIHPNTQNSQAFTGCWAPFNQCVWNSPVSQLAQCQQTYNQCMSSNPNSNSSPPPSSGNPFISSSPAEASTSTLSTPPTTRLVSQRAVTQVAQSRDAYFQQLSGQLDGYINASIAVLDNNLRQLLAPPPEGSAGVVLSNPLSNQPGSFNDDESDDLRNLLNEVLDGKYPQLGYTPAGGSLEGSPTDNDQSAPPVAAQPPAETTQNDTNGGDPNVPSPDSAPPATDAPNTDLPATNAPSVSASGNPFADNPVVQNETAAPEVDAGANTPASGGLLGWAQQGFSNLAQQAAAAASSAYASAAALINAVAHPIDTLDRRTKTFFCGGYESPTDCPANGTDSNLLDPSSTAINNRAQSVANSGQEMPEGFDADPSAEPSPSPTPDPATSTDYPPQ
jgi:hypothetical protein